MKRRINRLLAATGIAGLAIALFAALALAAPHSGRQPRHSRHHSYSTRHATLDAVDPTAVFAVLARPRTASDTVDPTLNPESLPGASSARALAVSPKVGRAWLTTNGNLVCLAAVTSDGAGSICDTISFAATNGIALTLSDDAPSVSLFAALPDGVGGVTVTATDGQRTSLPVSTNALAQRFTTGTSTMSFTLGGTARSVPLPFTLR